MSSIVIVMLIHLRHKPTELVDESLVDVLFTVKIPCFFHSDSWCSVHDVDWNVTSYLYVVVPD
jgi:hypothetical protein